ncbi:TPA: hypothetical protein NGU48_004774 [Vibrio parahaemolyticus]|uniref:hypothetical protein n=1 Tax=Vibrio parahaemolyticus TaxID=670 RepID=UPI00111D1B62|nr:hypothetical protein [Vibrio parahaemolyticus]MBE4296028.1 hypothetical protein [Vibrio parahaemolyticus]MBM4987390.1 hypothetical protein [Vibrio parahaemolyticus]MCG6508304.1 hypothetical protein [Vibrio parahaemolyticus]TOI34735.1 hypothetical protein CGI61_23370 [Vibrio parahaemolyticus]HCE2112332.1 hypothetical protein [Vibrio parahaemolyticus]
MSYSEEQLGKLYKLRSSYDTQLQKIQENFLVLSAKMDGGLYDHTVYGICRRVSTLRFCLNFFFDALSPETDVLENDVLPQGNVHLHAFLVNCSGVSDNIAWFLAYHHKVDEIEDLDKFKFNIGIFGKKKFKKYITDNLSEKIKEFQDWHEHIKAFRDPTAHRIPPYLIPYVIDTDRNLIDCTPKYIHEFSKSVPVLLHAQVIADIGAVIGLLEALFNDVLDSYA